VVENHAMEDQENHPKKMSHMNWNE
jgi:hypothetical protein